jgi:hypothetical protein
MRKFGLPAAQTKIADLGYIQGGDNRQCLLFSKPFAFLLKYFVKI